MTLTNERQFSSYEWAMRHVEEPEEQLKLVKMFIASARLNDGRWRSNHCYLVLAEIFKNSGVGAFSTEGLAQRKFPNYPRIVMTTNFDPLLHYALLARDSEEPKLIRHWREMEYMEVDRTEVFPVVAHLHGYWQNHRIFADPAAWEDFGSRWASQLKKVLENCGLVVLGYGGRPDDVVFKILRNHAETNGRLGGNIYWCHLRGRLNSEIRKELEKLANVFLVEISDADSFMLKLGVELGLSAVHNIARFASVCVEFPAGEIAVFSSHADVRVDESRKDGFCIEIETSMKYDKSGENYGGIDIFTINKILNISDRRNLEFRYDASLSKKIRDGHFEVKLHSADASHIERIPVSQNFAKLPLAKFSKAGVDLGRVDRIGFATNCDQIGRGNKLTLLVKSVRFSSD